MIDNLYIRRLKRRAMRKYGTLESPEAGKEIWGHIRKGGLLHEKQKDED